MQRERRRDPYPWTWEIPLGVAVLVLLALTSAVQVGRGLANLLAGAGWTWPSTADAAHSPGPGPGSGQFGSPVDSTFWTSLPDVVSGNATAGLNPPPGRMAGTPLLWCSLATTELVAITALTAAAVAVLRRWGPGRLKGMALAAEAEALLGVTRLRSVRSIVRPDLYAGRSQGRQGENESAGGAGPARRRGAGASAWRLWFARHPLGSGTSIRGGQPVNPREQEAPSIGPDLARRPSPWLLDSRARTSGTRAARPNAPEIHAPRALGEYQ